MKSKRQIFLFQIISWVTAYVALTIILHLFDMAKPELKDNELESLLLFKLRVSLVAGVIIGIAMGVIDILLNKLSNKKRSFRFYISVRGLLYILVFLLADLITLQFLLKYRKLIDYPIY